MTRKNAFWLLYIVFCIHKRHKCGIGYLFITYIVNFPLRLHWKFQFPVNTLSLVTA